jgi:hypothetical protein
LIILTKLPEERKIKNHIGYDFHVKKIVTEVDMIILRKIDPYANNEKTGLDISDGRMLLAKSKQEIIRLVVFNRYVTKDQKWGRRTDSLPPLVRGENNSPASQFKVKAADNYPLRKAPKRQQTIPSLMSRL